MPIFYKSEAMNKFDWGSNLLNNLLEIGIIFTNIIQSNSHHLKILEKNFRALIVFKES